LSLFAYVQNINHKINNSFKHMPSLKRYWGVTIKIFQKDFYFSPETLKLQYNTSFEPHIKRMWGFLSWSKSLATFCAFELELLDHQGIWRIALQDQNS
jgi:hypothetical protein